MTVRPSDYPPPFDAREFVGEPTDPVDERIEVGILIIGAGPAGLACAIRLGQLLEEHPDVAERLGEVPVALVEKGKQPGSHLLSGAVVNPRAFRRLGFRVEDLPSYGPVEGEAVYVLTRRCAHARAIASSAAPSSIRWATTCSRSGWSSASTTGTRSCRRTTCYRS